MLSGPHLINEWFFLGILYFLLFLLNMSCRSVRKYLSGIYDRSVYVDNCFTNFRKKHSRQLKTDDKSSGKNNSLCTPCLTYTADSYVYYETRWVNQNDQRAHTHTQTHTHRNTCMHARTHTCTQNTYPTCIQA